MALAGACLFGCADPPPRAPEVVRPTSSAPAVHSRVGDVAGIGLEQELEDVTFRQSRSAVTQWELHAERVIQRSDGLARLTGVTLRFFGDGPENDPVVVTAEKAEYDVEEQNVTLQGSVHIATAAGDTLETDRLVWVGATEALQTDAEVTLRRGTSYITGQGLETSPNMEDVRIFKVKGIIHDAELAG